MTDIDTDWVWLKHPDIERPGRVHVDAADAWRERGWVDTTSPPEPQTVVDPTVWGPQDPHYDELKVDELKAELAERDLRVSGNKPELVERLETADADGATDTTTGTADSAPTGTTTSPRRTAAVRKE